MTVVVIGIDPHKNSHTATAIHATRGDLGTIRVQATRSNTVQLRLRGCSLVGCLVLDGPSLCRPGGCRIWCRWECCAASFHRRWSMR